MPVLFLTVAAFIFFVLVLAALAVARVIEQREARHFSLRLPGRPFSALSVVHAFEEHSAVLWDTQIPALQVICSAGPKGVHFGRVRRVYAMSARRYPELYDGTSFEQWLRFLAEAELITFQEDRIAITAQGRQFLKYRVTPSRPVAA